MIANCFLQYPKKFDTAIIIAINRYEIRNSFGGLPFTVQESFVF